MSRSSTIALAASAAVLILGAPEAGAYRMIQNTSTSRTSTGVRVLCDDPGGFTHWTTSSISWRVNLSNQGGEPGVSAALQNALASWTSVSPASYVPSLAGTTNAAFATDGINTVLWGVGNGCSGSCLAITALVLAPGQVIVEADISFNNAVNWNTNGSDYDVEAIAAHEFGHTLGIHHTDLTKPKNRPTMYTAYFGTAGRTLETDDRDALNCAYSRYLPVGGAVLSAPVAEAPSRPTGGAVALTSRLRPRGANLRFDLDHGGTVRLDVFDIAGRNLATLVNSYKDPGQYEVSWDGSAASGAAHAGVYFARIVTPEGTGHATVVLAN
jgi:hypothetical protein